MKNFYKHTGHFYTVKNQNGFNNALYDFYGADDSKNSMSKKHIRSMVQDFPKNYPCSIIIIDMTFECNRIYIETFDLKEQAHLNIGFNF